MDKFTGFDLPSENWSKLPHSLIEALPNFSSLAELKTVLYILRHTWGYQEFEDWEAKRISTDEFISGRKRRDGTRLDGGIGMHKQSVYDGLSQALLHGFVVKYVDNTDLGRVTHYYRLRQSDDEIDTIYAVDPTIERDKIAWHTIDPDIKKAVYSRFGGRCAYCERKVRDWHYDHIVPVAQGGPSDFDNLALACPPCNLSKNNRTPDQWGRPVIIYINEEKREYRGWTVYLNAPSPESRPGGSDNQTGGSPESRHRTEKETQEANSINTPPPVFDREGTPPVYAMPKVRLTQKEPEVQAKKVSEPEPDNSHPLHKLVADIIGRKLSSTNASLLDSPVGKYESPRVLYDEHTEAFARYVRARGSWWNGIPAATRKPSVLINAIRKYDTPTYGWFDSAIIDPPKFPDTTEIDDTDHDNQLFF